MAKLKWKFSTPLEHEGLLEDFENEYGVSIPTELKRVITEHNGGVPDEDIFDYPKQGMIFAGLLSFNHGDEETVYMAANQFLQNGKLRMLPFATNGFGDFICLKNNRVVLWKHESDSTEEIAGSVEIFLNLLHD